MKDRVIGRKGTRGTSGKFQGTKTSIAQGRDSTEITLRRENRTDGSRKISHKAFFEQRKGGTGRKKPTEIAVQGGHGGEKSSKGK